MAEPLLSIHQNCTPHLSFEEDLDLYRKFGARGVGINPRLKLSGDGSELESFRKSGLAASVCDLRLGTLRPNRRDPTPRGFRERVREVEKSLDELEPFEPDCCVCSVGTGEGGERVSRDGIVDALASLARRAAGFGAKLALEPIHGSIRSAWTSVGSWDDTVDICKTVGAENFGIVVDIWHVWDVPELLEKIQRDAAWIVGVQLDDRREPTRSWRDRVLPGDGIGGVKEIVGALQGCGYSGWYDLEILSDDGTHEDAFPDSLWRDPVVLVQAGMDKMKALLAGEEGN